MLYEKSEEMIILQLSQRNDNLPVPQSQQDNCLVIPIYGVYMNPCLLVFDVIYKKYKNCLTLNKLPPKIH